MFVPRKADMDMDMDLIANEEELESESLLKFKFRSLDDFVQSDGNVGFSNDDQVLNDHSNDKENVENSRIQGFVENVSDIIAKPMEGDIIEPKKEGLGDNVSYIIAKSMEDGIIEPQKEGLLENVGEMIAKSTKGDIIEPKEEGVLENVGEMIAKPVDFISDDESLVSDLDSDSDSGSMVLSSDSSFGSSIIDSISDGYLSDIDFERAFEVDTMMENGYFIDEFKLTSEISIEDENDDISQEFKDLDSIIGENDENQENGKKSGSVSPDDKNEADFKQEWEELEDLDSNLGENDENKPKNQENIEKPSSVSPDDEQNEVDFEQEWEEHQDLVEQLKMEIKKVRMVEIGLPTILEESESIPKIMDDLKPWKIEGDKGSNSNAIMDDIHKVYKSYRQRMRKLDILNYQKMYAIGFTNSKISNRAIASTVSVDCWPCKPKTTSQTQQPELLKKKFSKEIQCDLEMIYVGQMCLSWEFLCWEYGKALELWESDPYEARRYNDVANKFQAFQVLFTRFLEDEPFEGPRVQHYVKTRCLFRNLLQVPAVRDDNYKNQNKERKVISSKEAITSLQLLQIIEKCILILWRFIRIDNDTSNVVVVNCRQSFNVELQNPADASLLAKVRSTLDKKEKKIRKSENCVRRNLERCQEEEEEENGNDDKVLYFFSKVDMKLVSRVLNMSRISREQLIWCINKLNNIKFVGNKLHVDSSLLLFACS